MAASVYFAFNLLHNRRKREEQVEEGQVEEEQVKAEEVKEHPGEKEEEVINEDGGVTITEGVEDQLEEESPQGSRRP